MKLDRILCPTDYSEASKAALSRAVKLARQNNTQLHILNVYELMFADGYIDGMAAMPVAPDTVALKKRLESQKPVGLTPIYELIYGIPASTIVSYAQANDIDLIVLGTHSRTGLDRLLMGSVAESVIRAAHCPVLTVHAAVQTVPESQTDSETAANFTLVW